MGTDLPLSGGDRHFQGQTRGVFLAKNLDGEDILSANPQAFLINEALRLMHRQKTFANQLQDQAADLWKRKPAERKSERDKIAGPSASRLAQKSSGFVRIDPDSYRGESHGLPGFRHQTGSAILHRIERCHAAAARRMMRLALIPPKAKELLRAVRIGIGRASFGTASTGHFASASRQLMVGGAIFSRTAPIVTTSSSAPPAPSAWPWMGFVEETGRFASRFPKMAAKASDSVASFTVVPVP